MFRSSGIVHSVLADTEDAPHAPFILFDAVPTFGCKDNIVSLTLSAPRFLPGPNGVIVKPTVTGHVRCSREAAMHLRDAIDKALLMSAASQGPAN